jgi:hypothetical protein
MRMSLLTGLFWFRVTVLWPAVVNGVKELSGIMNLEFLLALERDCSRWA